MNLIQIEGRKHVSFDCDVVAGFNKNCFFNLANLDGMYCLVLHQLRSSTGSTNPQVKRLNLKRRRLLLYVRRALRKYDNGRRLPLDIRKNKHAKRVAKINGYTILG